MPRANHITRLRASSFTTLAIITLGSAALAHASPRDTCAPFAKILAKQKQYDGDNATIKLDAVQGESGQTRCLMHLSRTGFMDSVTDFVVYLRLSKDKKPAETVVLYNGEGTHRESIWSLEKGGELVRHNYHCGDPFDPDDATFCSIDIRYIPALKRWRSTKELDFTQRLYLYLERGEPHNASYKLLVDPPHDPTAPGKTYYYGTPTEYKRLFNDVAHGFARRALKQQDEGGQASQIEFDLHRALAHVRLSTPKPRQLFELQAMADYKLAIRPPNFDPSRHMDDEDAALLVDLARALHRAGHAREAFIVIKPAADYAKGGAASALLVEILKTSRARAPVSSKFCIKDTVTRDVCGDLIKTHSADKPETK